MGDRPLATQSEIKLLEIRHPAFFLAVRKHTRVAVTPTLGIPDSRRWLGSTGKTALVLQSVEEQSRSCDFMESHSPHPLTRTVN